MLNFTHFSINFNFNNYFKADLKEEVLEYREEQRLIGFNI